jgi:hypothetical protein
MSGLSPLFLLVCVRTQQLQYEVKKWCGNYAASQTRLLISDL